MDDMNPDDFVSVPTIDVEELYARLVKSYVAAMEESGPPGSRLAKQHHVTPSAKAMIRIVAEAVAFGSEIAMSKEAAAEVGKR